MASEKPEIRIHVTDTPDEKSAKHTPQRQRMRIKTRLSFQERLLRNSCLACAVLLGILALGNLQQPWAQKAASSIEHALTMRIDPDRSLGQLSFVQKLMPESALVFFNLGDSHELALPVQGELSHAYSTAQPWLMFACEDGSAICATDDGVISAVSPLSDGSFGVLIDHGSGLESIAAGLTEVKINVGDEVLRSGVIGSANSSIYFELRQNGEAIDPTEKMGL